MKTDKELKKFGYKYLGWMNGWSHPYPEEYENCQKENHHPERISYSNRGLHNTIYCDICKYFCNYDSSD
jgi:hypothetical protein